MKSRHSLRLKALPFLFPIVALLGTPAAAQTAAVSSGGCPYWIDAKTGDRVPTVPIGITREELLTLQRGIHPNQAHGAGAHDYVKTPDGTWIDAATGNSVPTVPLGITREELLTLQRGIHPNQAHGAWGARLCADSLPPNPNRLLRPLPRR